MKNKYALLNFINLDYKKKDPEIDYSKLQSAIKNSNIGIWVFNVKTNEVHYSSESKKLLGFNDYEFKNLVEEWNKRVHPDDRDVHYNNFKAYLNGELEEYSIEHRVLCKDGTYKWILDQGKIINKDKNGEAIRIIGTHIDITEYKKNEEALKDNLLISTNRNKRLYNFTHIVSHNFKTHFGNLESLLKLYENEKNEGEKNQIFKYLKNISSSLNNTISDLDEIINIKCHTTASKDKINIAEILSKILHNLALDIDKKDALIHNYIHESTYIMGNASYFESIFHNLICNAIKYSHPNRNPKISIESIQEPNEFKIIVSDNGIGINLNKYESQVFKMYQTFHGTQRKDSKGIGLYLIKMQVENLGGQIEIDSKLGIGSSFILSFPNKKVFHI